MRGLGGAQPDDRILFSDCDEIPKPHLLRKALAFRGLSHRIVAFWCENYFYRLNLLNETFDHRLGPRLLTMSNLKSPNAVRAVQFRFSSRRYLRPVATPMAALRVRSRLGKFLWPTIFWNGAWHFTNMGDVAAVNLKFSTYAHAHEVEQLTEVTYKNQMATFKKCPLADLPRAIQQDRYAHLLA